MSLSYLVENFWSATISDRTCRMAYCRYFASCFLIAFLPNDSVLWDKIVLCDFRNFFVGVTACCSCCACIMNCKSPAVWVRHRSAELDFLLMKFHQFPENMLNSVQIVKLCQLWDFIFRILFPKHTCSHSIFMQPCSFYLLSFKYI